MSDANTDDPGPLGQTGRATPPSRPIWHSPAWITAIVGLVSAFLTVPDIIGSYFEKQQEIDLAKVKTETARLSNLVSKQEQEFQIINETLAQQGTERVFVIRYLSYTLDDEDAKLWAEEEVSRLDQLASLEEALEQARIELADKEKNLILLEEDDKGQSENTRKEIADLESQLKLKAAELAESRQKAGISPRETFRVLHVKIRRKPSGSVESVADSVWVQMGSVGVRCTFYEEYCERYLTERAPEILSVTSKHETDHLLFDSLSVKTIEFQRRYASDATVTVVSYKCEALADKVRCLKAEALE